MGNLVYPANLPGLLPEVSRSPTFNTAVQAALSGKESRMAYQQYPIVKFELQYELLRDYVTPSDLKALVGLFIACQGQWDTFLFSDPSFNTVSNQQIAVTDGVTTAFQTTASYQNSGGPGGQEIIQNFNGAPVYYLNRFGILEQLSPGGRTVYLKYNEDFTQASAWTPAGGNNSLLAGGSSPLGTTSSYINENNASVVEHYASQTATVPGTSGAPYTFSCFVAPGVRGWVILRMIEGASGHVVYCSFNASTGAIGTPVTTGTNWSGLTVAVFDLPGVSPWMRFSISATKQSASTTIQCVIDSATGDGGFTYAGAASSAAVYLWGAQLENELGPTLLVPTTTAAVTQTDYTLGATGIIATILFAAGAFLSWSGSFFYRCRFDDDSFTATQFMQNFWAAKKVAFSSVKL